MAACRETARLPSASRCRLAGDRYLAIRGEQDATLSACYVRDGCARVSGRARLCPAAERQELPDGAAVPLGELQEDMRMGEGLPLAAGSEVTTK